MEHGFNWVSIIPVLQDLPTHVAFGLIIFMVLAIMAIAVSRKMATPDAYIVPERTLTVRNAVELVVELLVKLAQETMGKHWKHFFPLIASFAFFIFFSNISGQIPGFLPPTDNLNTTAALALIVFFLTHFYGFKANGIKYLKHFVGPIWWMAPLMVPIEIIGHLARPVSLSMRLFGNIFGDHMVLSVFVLLVPLIVPLPMMALGVFVAFIQTFVFTLLSMTYISGAMEHTEEH